MTDATWLRAEIDRLDRNRAEIQKRFLEQPLKFNRDAWIIAMGAVVAALVFRLPEILHAFGIGH